MLPVKLLKNAKNTGIEKLENELDISTLILSVHLFYRYNTHAQKSFFCEKKYIQFRTDKTTGPISAFWQNCLSTISDLRDANVVLRLRNCIELLMAGIMVIWLENNRKISCLGFRQSTKNDEWTIGIPRHGKRL